MSIPRERALEQRSLDLTASCVVPVLNEEAQLSTSVVRLAAALEEFFNCRGEWEIVIADNGSTDRTAKIGQELAVSMARVRYMRCEQRGRGLALKRAWGNSKAQVLAYTDVDLSTDLRHLPRLLQAVISGKFDLALGSRLAPEAETHRKLAREILSRVYNLLTRASLGTRIRDLQCGFKAISRAAAISLLPIVESEQWFFDTELVILAEQSGYRICELPVRWVDDPGTRVRILPTVVEDLRGLMRLRRQLRLKVDYLKEKRRERCQMNA